MAAAAVQVGHRVVVGRESFAGLLETLRDLGYRTVGPTVRDGAIVYDEIHRAEDLPAGWGVETRAGHFRLVRRDDGALFGYTVPADSWKKYLHVPRETIWRIRRSKTGFDFVAAPPEPPCIALLGVRACELSAIAIQDRVLIEGQHADPHYAARRRNAFLIVVQCTEAGSTCFCVSMKTGPRAANGFDLALTEIIADGRHEFVVEVGSAAGGEVIARVPHSGADGARLAEAEKLCARAAGQMGRALATEGLREVLLANLQHRRWDEVARRCLGCGSCTLACPTCFCSDYEDGTDLGGAEAHRTRCWDSCFSLACSYIHGGSVRPSMQARYRQWLTHKLASWIDQFGTAGCVGCGRCITWCPAGIDITEEAAALRTPAKAPALEKS